MLRISFFKALIVPFFMFTMNVYASPTTPTPMTLSPSNPLPDAFSCNLPAPTGVVTVNTTTTSIEIAWNAVVGASQYHVKAVTDLGVTVFDGNVATPTLLVNAPPATTVDFVISAVCSNGERSPNNIKYKEATDSIIIDDVATSFPGFPQDITCDQVFALGTNVNERIYFKVVNIQNADDYKVFGLHRQVSPVINANPFAAVLTFQNTSNFVFANDLGQVPLGVAVPAQFSQVFRENVYIMKIEIKKVSTNTVTVCGISQSQLSGSQYKIVRLTSTPWGLSTNNSGEIEGTNGNASSLVSVYEDGEFDLISIDQQSVSIPSTPQLHPNPFTDGITLSLPETSTEAATLRIFDLNGKEVMTENIEIGTSSKSMQTTDLTPGMYFARLESANSVKTFKMCKSK